MHEFGLVDEFIEKLIEIFSARREKPRQVVRVGFGPGLTEDALRQAFQVHTTGTLLAGVRFEFMKKIDIVPCQCGSVLPKQVEADLPYAVCDQCQQVSTIEGFNRLELMDAY